MASRVVAICFLPAKTLSISTLRALQRKNLRTRVNDVTLISWTLIKITAKEKESLDEANLRLLYPWALLHTTPTQTFLVSFSVTPHPYRGPHCIFPVVCIIQETANLQQTMKKRNRNETEKQNNYLPPMKTQLIKSIATLQLFISFSKKEHQEQRKERTRSYSIIIFFSVRQSLPICKSFPTAKTHNYYCTKFQPSLALFVPASLKQYLSSDKDGPGFDSRHPDPTRMTQ